MFSGWHFCFSGRFKEWELCKVHKGFWTQDKGIEAARWLFEEKLKWSEEEIVDKISSAIFLDNGFSAIFRECFNNSPYNVLNALYSGKYEQGHMNTLNATYPNKFKWN